ncbi:hypothetical protein PR048_016756 [Dryococelus australis]|uniref:Uncharacterized protein n=1 Tax=Dryococelus australis TaxID=614101 RepID=A0ABQ9H7L4_9NEOP|nr:hypothetical protein PR048_016756 [Dryococelus australis]
MSGSETLPTALLRVEIHKLGPRHLTASMPNKDQEIPPSHAVHVACFLQFRHNPERNLANISNASAHSSEDI